MIDRRAKAPLYLRGAQVLFGLLELSGLLLFISGSPSAAVLPVLLGTLGFFGVQFQIFKLEAAAQDGERRE